MGNFALTGGKFALIGGKFALTRNYLKSRKLDRIGGILALNGEIRSEKGTFALNGEFSSVRGKN